MPSHTASSNTHIQRSWRHSQEGKITGCFLDCSCGKSGRNAIDNFLTTEELSAQRWQLAEKDLNQPFSPFLPLIQQVIKQRKISPVSLLDAIQLQGQYREILLRYFQGKSLHRRELPIPDDLHYEQNYVADVIVQMFVWLSQQAPLCLAVSEFQLAGPSSLKLLQRLLEHKDTASLLLLIHLEPDYIQSNEKQQEHWQSFLDWLNSFQGRFSLAPKQTSSSQSWPKAPDVHNHEPRALLKQCESLLALMCLQEAALACERVEQIFVQKGLTHDTSSRLHLQALKGHCQLYIGELDEAFEALDNILEQAQFSADKRAMARAYRHLCWAYIYKQDLTQALNCGRQAANYGEQLTDQREQVQCLFYYFVACSKANSEFGIERFSHMLQLLQQQKMDNAIIFACRNLYVQLQHEPKLTLKQAMLACQEAIRVARSIHQLSGLAASYHSRAILLHNMAQNHAAERCFKVSEGLLRKIDDPLDLAKVHNGFGYFYTQQENYLEAWDYFNSALQQVSKVAHVNETINSLFNLAWLYLTVRDYNQSSRVLEKLRRLMTGHHTYFFAFRNLHDVHLTQGLVHTFNQEWLRAGQCLERSQRLSIPLSQSAALLRPMLALLLQTHEQQSFPSTSELSKVEAKLSSSRRLMTSIPLLWLEVKIRIAQLCGQHDQCEHLLKQAEHVQQQWPLGWQALHQLAQGKSAPLINLPHPIMALEHLIVLAQQEARLNQLWKRMREVRLISALQAIGFEADSEQKIAHETIRLLSGHYDFQLAMVVSCQDEKTTVIAVHVDGQIRDFPIDELATQVMNFRNQQILLNRNWLLGPMAMRLKMVCVMPLREGNFRQAQLVLVNTDQHFIPSKHEQEVLTLIANQMSAQLTAVRQQNRLIALSSVDTLTGLANRQSLQSTIQDEMNRVRRYSGSTGYMSLAFIDLDNFKYYNDTFGHDAGDRLLQWFAELLQEQLRDVDVPGRWGGDEFIIFMPETKAESAAMVGQRILNALESRRGFQERLGKVLKRAVNISEQKWLRCSIGITETNYQTGNPDAASLLNEADKALYKAKLTGKGKVLRFGEDSLKESP